VNTFWALSLPGLVVILVVGIAIEQVLVRRRNRRADAEGRPRQKPVVAGVAFDALGQTFAPSTRHKKEHDEYQELRRDEEGDAAPPRSVVDLDAGVARIVLPSPPRDEDQDPA